LTLLWNVERNQLIAIWKNEKKQRRAADSALPYAKLGRQNFDALFVKGKVKKKSRRSQTKSTLSAMSRKRLLT
jgi:hypothetical protein